MPEKKELVGKYHKVAQQFCEHIKTIANKPENMDNFRRYLEFCFGEWLKKYAYDPENLTAEMREFANMEI